METYLLNKFLYVTVDQKNNHKGHLFLLSFIHNLKDD